MATKGSAGARAKIAAGAVREMSNMSGSASGSEATGSAGTTAAEKQPASRSPAAKRASTAGTKGRAPEPATPPRSSGVSRAASPRPAKGVAAPPRNPSSASSSTGSRKGSRDGASASPAETRESLAALLSLVTALSQAKSSEDAILSALETVREGFGWAYGSHWVWDAKGECLRFAQEAGEVGADFRRATQRARFPSGVGLCGRAYEERELVFVEDLAEVDDCPRAPAARKAGVRSGLCLPIVVEDEVVGTLDFFTLQALRLSEERTEVLRQVGGLVSSTLARLRDVERQRAEASELAQIRTMVDLAPVNVMLANAQLEIVYLNASSKRTLERLEKHLPMRADAVLGATLDRFHKDPAHQRRLLADPRNLPHRAVISLGPEKLDLLVTAVLDDEGTYVGPMLTWELVTEKLENERRIAEAEAREAEVAKQTAESAQTLASAAEEFTAVSDKLSESAGQNSNQASGVSAAAEQVNRNMQTVATSTEEMTASIREIAQSASTAARVVAQAVEEASNISGQVKKLGDSGTEIGKMIKVITAIAQQTNLLALNATIEAARAGEAGKGFAVVANEVKELAKQTAKATEDIGSMVEAIQTNTRTSIVGMQEIGRIVREISSLQDSIASAVEEQTATTREIARNVSEAAQGTGEIAHAITEMVQTATETAASAAQVRQSAGELSRMAADLERLALDKS